MNIYQFLATTAPTNSSLYLAIQTAKNDLVTCSKAALANNCQEESSFYNIILELLKKQTLYAARDIIKDISSFDFKNSKNEYRVIVSRDNDVWVGKILGTRDYSIRAKTIRELLANAKTSIKNKTVAVASDFDEFLEESFNSIKIRTTDDNFEEFVLHFTV